MDMYPSTPNEISAWYRIFVFMNFTRNSCGNEAHSINLNPSTDCYIILYELVLLRLVEDGRNLRQNLRFSVQKSNQRQSNLKIRLDNLIE